MKIQDFGCHPHIQSQPGQTTIRNTHQQIRRLLAQAPTILLVIVLTWMLSSGPAWCHRENFYWYQHNEAYQQAYREHRYADAERELLIAIQVAREYQEGCELEHSLRNLRRLYAEQGKWVDATVVESQAWLATIKCLYEINVLDDYAIMLGCTLIGIIVLPWSIKQILRRFR